MTVMRAVGVNDRRKPAITGLSRRARVDIFLLYYYVSVACQMGAVFGTAAHCVQAAVYGKQQLHKHPSD